MTAAIEAAEAGYDVILVEKSPWLGGQVASFNKYFPKLCPPSCGLEINFKRLRNNARITVLTLAELEKLQGSPGNYEAVIRVAPRFVSAACTACELCVAACPVEIADPFNFGLTKTKAIHARSPIPYPGAYVVERSACKPDCRACVDQCAYGAIDFGQSTRSETFRVASVVIATGWTPYDATRLDNLGFGQHANVVTNVIMERLAAPNGPMAGKVLRPSDRQPPKSVAFVQCAGSRDRNHLAYCSAVCCSASLKQATYLRTQDPETKVTIFYIDVRTPGQLQEFAAKVRTDAGIELIKGKVGKVEEDPQSKDLIVTFEDVLNNQKVTRKFGLLVLATGITPQTKGLPVDLPLDEFGFFAGNGNGILGAGCAKRPAEVSATIRDATGVALKALQIAAGAIHHG